MLNDERLSHLFAHPLEISFKQLEREWQNILLEDSNQ